MNKYFVVFVTEHLYYLPQYLPIADELKRKNHSHIFLLTGDDEPDKIAIAKNFLSQNNYQFHDYSQDKRILSCKHMICGAHFFARIPVEYEFSSFVVHGIGTKAGNFIPEQNRYDIRFVEGSFREEYIRKLYPDIKTKLYNVGFAKLDPAINITDKEKRNLISKIKLDPNKKTILYAPTFYPSSIENMPTNFPKDFCEYNLIIKPHFFSFSKSKYKHQVKRFKKWEKYTNVYFAQIEEFNLTPYMAIADLMITDESSAIFEFAALDKPVICNRNVHYRLSYRLFKWKIKKRMESSLDTYRKIATNVFNYNELIKEVSNEIANPGLNRQNRIEMTEQIVGCVDGKVSERIVNILEKY